MAAIPPRAEDLIADPGEVITRQIKVRNMGNAEMDFEAKLLDFLVQDREGTPVFLDDELSEADNRWALSQWVNVSPFRFVIKPGEIKELDLVITVPEDALAGGHYAAVIYQPTGSRIGEEGSATKVIPSVATLLYLTVSGDITEEAFVKRMDIPKLSEFGPIKIISEITNLSDIHIKPSGVIKIYNLFNKLSTSLQLDEYNIFPSRSRIYENIWEQKWLLGRYKAELEGAYGSQGQTLLAIAYFWVIPYRLILVGLLAITLAILLIAYLRKKRNTDLSQ